MNSQLTVGILAHVDAGKTPLAEGILYLTGKIRSLGRVDHQDAFLDNFVLERTRGITIFSKQARVSLAGDPPLDLTLLDTPGHVDFSAEMERTLQVLDYAILVISGADGVQSHVETLWRLLSYYKVPVFLFVNKMDQPGTDKAALLAELAQRLDGSCVDFSCDHACEEFLESVAMCSEELLESYLAGEAIRTESICELIAKRRLFPCFFGSALRLQGVTELLEGIKTYSVRKTYPEAFAARVYKITRDAQGNRLTHLKITGGCLKVKDVLSGSRHGETWEQKVNQLRLYSGAGFEPVPEACAGSICAATGLDYTYIGEGLGAQEEDTLPVLEPVLSYRMELPEGTDVHQAYRRLKQLEEEEPQLSITWAQTTGEIHVQLMGEVQTEVLASIIKERFGLAVAFGEGSIVYRETIAEPVVGMGHFEPLRHYAEVHLLLEPTEPGGGLQFESACSVDALDLNWQRLILTHLEEKKHLGVLTGSEVTDIKFTLIAGRAHIKHTEGGDFRQATYRAVRQGLMRARSILLEPVYQFRLEVPSEATGRALSDIQRMHGRAGAPELVDSNTVVTGVCPVVTMRGYAGEVLAYTKGRGRLTCTLAGYEPCHNAEEVQVAVAYDAASDLENPCGSVFCAHGAGFVVPWEQVPEYIHIAGTDLFAKEEPKEDEEEVYVPRGYRAPDPSVNDDELKAIFERTYGGQKRERNRFLYQKSRQGSVWAGQERRPGKPVEKLPECLLVDGYNIIFAWEELKELTKVSLDSARGRLLDLMSNYQGYKDMEVIVVFDAYRVAAHKTEILKHNNIYVVYTKEAETADMYIEKTVREMNKKYKVSVATSDALEQVIILGAGATRVSASGLKEELAFMRRDLDENYINRKKPVGKTYLLDGKNITL